MGIETVLQEAAQDIQTYDDLQTTAVDLAAQYDQDPGDIEDQLYSHIDEDPPRREMGHDELYTAIETLIKDIEDEYSPNAVVGISRGGNPIATALSYGLDVPYGTVDATHYDGDERLDEVRIDGEMLHDVEGEIVLADNLADTGQTLADVETYLTEHEDIETVITATLHTKPHSIIEPDIHTGTTIAWIEYPWEQ